ncbi:MAG: DUF4430 domain-containing protein [Ruminococcaceae bacterium]|nr:DUF4430 domain-containing protein [Oscillospiraceae bacterium]
MRTIKQAFAVLLVCGIFLCFISCGGGEKDVWANATYKEDTTLGEGAKTITVQVSADNKTVTFTVKTDKETVGDALMEHGLITGEEGQYGLYIKKVNGITADYDKDGYYWAFYIDGEYAMTGVDGTEISQDAIYKLEYAK